MREFIKMKVFVVVVVVCSFLVNRGWVGISLLFSSRLFSFSNYKHKVQRCNFVDVEWLLLVLHDGYTACMMRVWIVFMVLKVNRCYRHFTNSQTLKRYVQTKDKLTKRGSTRTHAHTHMIGAHFIVLSRWLSQRKHQYILHHISLSFINNAHAHLAMDEITGFFFFSPSSILPLCQLHHHQLRMVPYLDVATALTTIIVNIKCKSDKKFKKKFSLWFAIESWMCQMDCVCRLTLYISLNSRNTQYFEWERIPVATESTHVRRTLHQLSNIEIKKKAKIRRTVILCDKFKTPPQPISNSNGLCTPVSSTLNLCCTINWLKCRCWFH